jgi:CRP/FNR family transcriptional regulator, anaerobic regulatory protein
MDDIKKYVPLLKASFDAFFIAPIETWEEFAKKCEVVSFKKDEVIKGQNLPERHFYYILSGSVGIFLWKENNFVCLDFAFDGHFCSDYMSLLTKQPTPLQVVALENTHMLRMTAASYDVLTKQTVPLISNKNELIDIPPAGIALRLVAAEMSFVAKQQQQIELLTKSAKERYKILLKQFPSIQNRISQNHIASYLGITPQSLSRIRRQKRFFTLW